MQRYSQQRKSNKNEASQTCKFFLKGMCSYGDRCYNAHPEIMQQRMDPREYSVQLGYPENFQVDEKELERYHIQLDVAFSKFDARQELIIIRHGLSFYNYASSDFFYKTGFSYAEQPSRDVYQTNPLLIDSDLHPYGLLMCVNNGKNLHNVNVSTVFVSPLGRAIQTAYHLFKTHPNQMNIKFVVLPELTEVLSKVQDISNIRKQKENYGKLFDFSLMEETFGENIDFWQILNLEDEEEQVKIFSRYEHENQDPNNPKSIEQVLLKMMSENFPSALERGGNVYRRSARARSRIQEYVKDNKIDTSNSKIVVISHNCLLQNLNANDIDENGRVSRGDSLVNCEMRSISLYE